MSTIKYVVTEGSTIKENGEIYRSGEHYKGKKARKHIANSTIESEAAMKARTEIKKAKAEVKKAKGKK